MMFVLLMKLKREERNPSMACFTEKVLVHPSIILLHLKSVIDHRFCLESVLITKSFVPFTKRFALVPCTKRFYLFT